MWNVWFFHDHYILFYKYVIYYNKHKKEKEKSIYKVVIKEVNTNPWQRLNAILMIRLFNSGIGMDYGMLSC